MNKLMKILLSLCVLASFASAKKKITPYVDKVESLCDGSFRAVFGYKNNNNSDVDIANGSSNKLLGAEKDIQKEPVTKFYSGKNDSAFSVEFHGDSISWVLDGSEAIAYADDADYSCMSEVPDEVMELAKRIFQRDMRSLGPELDVLFPREGLSPPKIKNVTLGVPFRYYHSAENHFNKTAVGLNVMDVVEPQGKSWLFPYVYKNRTIGYSVIARQNGHWYHMKTNFNIDTRGIKSINWIHKKWSKKNGYNPFLVRFYYGDWFKHYFYFSVPEVSRTNLTEIVNEEFKFEDVDRENSEVEINSYNKYEKLGKLNDEIEKIKVNLKKEKTNEKYKD